MTLPPQPLMPQTSASRHGAFLESLIRFLLPFFIGTAVDIDAARAEILETLGSYGTRTRAELLNAARIIAFGMATLDTLAESKEADLSPSMRVRYRGCANGLNRSTIQNEKILDQHLASELPQQVDPAPPHPVDPLTDRLNNLSDADLHASIASTQAKIQAYRDRQTGMRPVPSATAKQTNQNDRYAALSAGALMETLTEMGLPNGPAASG